MLVVGPTSTTQLLLDKQHADGHYQRDLWLLFRRGREREGTRGIVSGTSRRSAWPYAAASTITLPRESTVSGAPMTSRPSYGV